MYGWVVAVGLALGLAAALWWLHRAREGLEVETHKRSSAQRRAADAQRDLDYLTAPIKVQPDLPSEEQLPGALVAACARGQCVLVAGPGLARAVGLPSWRDVVLDAARDVVATTTEQPELALVVAEIAPGREAVAVDILAAQIGRQSLVERLRTAFERRPRGALPGHPALRDIRFAGVINTVWPDVSTRALAPPERRTVHPAATPEAMASVLLDETFFTVDLYWREDGSVLLSPDELADQLWEHPPYARFLASLTETHTLLFVGADVADIEALMRMIKHRGAGSSEHYALMPSTARASVQAQRLKSRYNVHLITVGDGDDALNAFLARLAADAAELAKQNDERTGTAPLEAIRLENIGLFRELQLDFGAAWNIVLGDNGAGKSTILRAIALALCGDDQRAAGAGERLLRSGARTGVIELTMGGTTYRTRLERRPSGVAVVPQVITPLQTGKWLVLGFPPVRGLGDRSERDAEVDTTARKPTVDDVLPLLTGEVDQRLDDVQTWLRGTLDGWLAKGAPPPSVERFFRVLSRLTPEDRGRQHLSYARTDDAGRIMVKTAEGEVPLEYVSQGMSSVLSWTGTLIARLEALTGDTLHLDKRAGTRAHIRAVVLVDEIDAHLHPAWQRRIVSAVRPEFPDLQVIATTHSPLVVGSLDGEKDDSPPRLWRLYRDGDKLRQERLDLGYRGWRADQILTSKAFDLPTAYDVRTQADLETVRHRHAEQRRSPEDQEELDALIADLDHLLRRPESRPIERAAAEFVSQWLDKELDELTEEERLELLHEAERYLTKLQGGV